MELYPADALKNGQHITFTWDDLCIKVYTSSNGSAENIWTIIKELPQKQ